MPKYDTTRYDPPAPLAIVSLRLSGNAGAPDSIQDVLLLIDTGADISVLPRSAVERLGAAPLSAQYEVIGIDGKTRFVADAADLDVLFLNKAFRGRYLLTDDEHGVLGRDVLNSVRLLLDGPGQEWSEQRVSP